MMMKKIILGISLFCLTLAAQAESNAKKAPTTKKTFGRDEVIALSTPDGQRYLEILTDKSVGHQQMNIRYTEPVTSTKTFCTGLGADQPDIMLLTRNMSTEELERCRDRGITDIIRVTLGTEAIIFAAEKSAILPLLDRKIIWRAFSKEVFQHEMVSSSRVIANPHKRWKDLNKAFPAQLIRLIAPVEKSPLFDSFKDLGLQSGCSQYSWIKDMQYHRHYRAYYKAHCFRARQDAVILHPGKKSISQADRIAADKTAIGLMSLQDWLQGDDRLQALAIEGVMPSLDSLRDGSYLLARPHYMFVKQAHLDKLPALKKLFAEMTSEAALGKGGYFEKMALVQTQDRDEAQTKVIMPKKKPVKKSEKTGKNSVAVENAEKTTAP